MSVKYEKVCVIIRTSCTRVEQVRNDVAYDNYNAHVAIESFIIPAQTAMSLVRSMDDTRRKIRERKPSASDLMKGKCSASKYREAKSIKEYLPLKHEIVETADEAEE